MTVEQKIFNIKIKTTNAKINEKIIKSIINKAIGESEYSIDLTYKLGKTEITYDFIENIEIFYAFLKYNTEEFFKKYPYLTQDEYYLTICAFNHDRINILLNFIEYTNSKNLAEINNLIPKECNKAAVDFAKRFLTKNEWDEFINTAEEKGLKLIL